MVLVWGWTLSSNVRRFFTAVLVALVMLVSPAHAMELAIIVHKSNSVQLSQEQLQHVLLNKQKFFQANGKIRIYHQPPRSAAHEWLCRQLLYLTPAQYQSYWSRLLFTGNADALVYVDAAKILPQVAADPEALSYVPLSDVTAQVRVLGVLSEQGYQPHTK